jgi:uncharacterized protein
MGVTAMLHKLTQHEINSLINEFRNYALAKYKENIDKIYLYGSYARGDNDEESDIDICVIVKNDKSNPRYLREEFSDIQCELGLKYGVLISLLFKTKDEFEERIQILPFYMNIVNEGVTLYE